MISVPNPNLGAQSYKNPEVKATAPLPVRAALSIIKLSELNSRSVLAPDQAATRQTLARSEDNAVLRVWLIISQFK